MSGPNVLCLYRDDLDGQCAAAIIKQVHPEAILSNMDRNDATKGQPVPWDLVGEADLVVLAGSLGHADMKLLVDCPVVVTWFEQDRVVIEELQAFDLALEGKRGVEKAICELVWEYYHPDLVAPEVVSYIADEHLRRFRYSDTPAFCEALKFEAAIPSSPMWDSLLTDASLYEWLVDRGQALLQAKRRRIRRDFEQRGYPVAFAWAKHGLAINSPGNDELGKYILSRGYTIAICYAHRVLDGTLMTQVWLYSDHVDVEKLAREYGTYDGGHSRAAQFHLPASEVLLWAPTRHKVE
jgi:hypothetical protein